MSPVLVRPWLCALAVPIDGGRSFRGKRILGDHKTWRGLLAGIFAGIFTYEVQRFLYDAEIAAGLALFEYGSYPFIPGLLMDWAPRLATRSNPFSNGASASSPAQAGPCSISSTFFRRLRFCSSRVCAASLGDIDDLAGHFCRQFAERAGGLLGRVQRNLAMILSPYPTRHIRFENLPLPSTVLKPRFSKEDHEASPFFQGGWPFESRWHH
jgi:hypothetical protein